ISLSRFFVSLCAVCVSRSSWPPKSQARSAYSDTLQPWSVQEESLRQPNYLRGVVALLGGDFCAPSLLGQLLPQLEVRFMYPGKPHNTRTETGMQGLKSSDAPALPTCHFSSAACCAA